MIEGYASAMSVYDGDEIGLYIGREKNDAARRAFGLSRYNIDSAFLRPFEIDVPERTKPAKPWEGYGWDKPHRFSTAGLDPGIYNVTDRAGGNVVATFVLKPRAPKSRIVLHAPFLTRQAYNGTGGKSLYSFGIKRVSLDRPFGAFTRGPFSVIEDQLVPWIRDNKVAIDYAASDDLEDYAFLSRYHCLLLADHDEYWTKAMRDTVEKFVANGGNLVSFSGNTCHRQARLSGRILEVHRYAGNDPSTDNEQVAVSWTQPPVNRSQTPLVGGAFNWGAMFSPKVTSDTQRKDSYRFHFPDHWITKDLDATSDGFMHYETDAVDFVPDAMTPRVTGVDGAPPTMVILGSADLRDWQKAGFATMTYVRRNGEIFSGGTTEWIAALGKKTSIHKITLRVLGTLGSRRTPAWEDIGEANDTTGLAATGERLFTTVTIAGKPVVVTRYAMCARMAWSPFCDAPALGQLAATHDMLFLLTQDGALYRRALAGGEWTKKGALPEGPAGAKAFTHHAGTLFAAKEDGSLRAVAAPPHGNGAPKTWYDFTRIAKKPLAGLAAADDILYALAPDGTLLRSDTDIIGEASQWMALERPKLPAARSLTTLARTLFAVRNNRLLATDITGLRFFRQDWANESDAALEPERQCTFA